MTYLILQHPGHNRVYYNSAEKLALAELQLACNKFSCETENLCTKEIGGIRYLVFSTNELLNKTDLGVLFRLSFLLALFIEEQKDGKSCLIPINKLKVEYLDSKISSILKYQGKTNELFTRMMINVAMLSCHFKSSDNIHLLDPVAGKGTTLFEAAVYGYNACGIEIESKSVHDSIVFFKKYLENERLKHKTVKRQIAGAGKTSATEIQEFEYARNKHEFKSKDTVKSLGIVHGNSSKALDYFKKELFHVIVGDLPYGIFHGNSGDKKSKSITRNPSELLAECIPAWKNVLKRGGAIVLAWNSFVVSRQKIASIFAENNFEVLLHPPFNQFEHRVDKSIKRDIIVALKS